MLVKNLTKSAGGEREGTMGTMLPLPLRVLARATPAGVPVARDAVRLLLTRVFGAPPFDTRQDLGDPGLFGPSSASWRIVGEPAAIVGGIRALLVQLLHPLAMAGVADHSEFREDALGRLHNTSAYVTTTTFGSTREALMIARRVRGVHRRVVGTAPDGRPYRASDPELLTWVSIALTSSFLAADRAYSPTPVDDPSADDFVAEQSRAAALLDPRVDLTALAADTDAMAALRAGEAVLPMLADGTLPRDVGELRVRLDSFRPVLAVNAQGREAFEFLVWPRLDPALRAAYLPMLAGALATLEPADLQLLSIPRNRLAARAIEWQAGSLLTALRCTTGLSPAREAARRRALATPLASGA